MSVLPFPTKILIAQLKYQLCTNSFLLWTPQWLGYHFWSKWVPLKPDKWKVYFASVWNWRQYNIQHCSFSQNVCRIFLQKTTTSLFITWLLHFSSYLSTNFSHLAGYQDNYPPDNYPPDNYPRTNTPRTITPLGQIPPGHLPPPEKFFKHLPWYSLYLYSSYSL